VKDKNFARILSVLSTLAVVGIFVALVPAPRVQAAAGINSQLSFEGKIVKSDGTNISNGTYNMEFKIYQDGNSSGSGSTLKWTEDWLVGGSGGVTLTNGTFQVNLGSHNAFAAQVDWNQDTLWLSLQIGNSSSCTISTNFHTDCSGDGEMTPFIRLTSVPYAQQAQTANSLSGLTAGNFVQLAQGLQTDSNTSNASIAINKTNSSGTPDILLLQKSGKNALEVNNSGTVLLGQAGASGLDGTLTFNNSAGSHTVSLALQADPGSSYTLLLPTTGPSTSQCLQTDSTTANQLKFAACSSGGGATSVSYSTSSNSNGGSISGGVLTLNKANGSNPGLLSADAQTIGGDKTFTSSVNVQTTNNSVSALQVQNSVGSSIFNVATAVQTNLIANSSFESSTAGWTGITGSETLLVDNYQVQNGVKSLRIQTAGANQGGKYKFYFKPNTEYNFSVYASIPPVSGSSVSTFDMGANTNGSTTACLTGQTVTNTAAQYTCTFTTGSTTTENDYIFVRTSAANNVWWELDNAQLEYGTTATTYRSDVYSNLISNPDFESNANGWKAKGGATITNSDDFAEFGSRSLKISASTTNDGAQFDANLDASTIYSLSFWVRPSSGSVNISLGRFEASDSQCNSYSIGAFWYQATCTFTTGVNGASSVYLKQTDATPHTIYIDGATLIRGGTSLSYSPGGVNLQIDPMFNNINLNKSNTAEIQPWRITNSINSLPASRSVPGVISANGYMYAVGGSSASPVTSCTPQSSVYYSKLNADGSPGSWQTNTVSLPVGRCNATTVTANGYLYVIGGSTASTPTVVNSIIYAKLNSDGTVGAWQTNPNNLPATTWKMTGLVVNGYLYIMGGQTSSAVYYSKLNADGTTGTWFTSSNSLPANAVHPSSTTYNGYIYVLGGCNMTSNSCTSGQNVLYYSRVNSDGSIGSWTNQSSNKPPAKGQAASFVLNGYIYLVSGVDSAGVNSSTVYYAKLNADGSSGPWQQSSNPLPEGRANTSVTVLNGYIYLVAGENSAGNPVSTILYSSASRISVAGSLDLVGISGQTLGDAGNGGSLTAGNTTVLGSLDVRDNVSLTQSLSIGGALKVNGGATIQSAAGSTNIFQVQNAGSLNVVNVSTVNLIANSNFETGQTSVDNQVQGWSKHGSTTTLQTVSTGAQFGSQAMQFVTTTSSQSSPNVDGVKYPINLLASQQYTLSFYAKVSTSTFATLTFGRSDTGSSETDCVTNGSISTTYARFSCSFTTGSSTSSSYIYITKGTNSATAWTINVDGVQLETGGTATGYRNSDITLDGMFSQTTSVVGGQNGASFSITDNSVSSGTVIGLSNTVTVSRTTAGTTYGTYSSIFDGTSVTNANYGLYANVNDSGSGAKTDYGVYGAAGGGNTSNTAYGGYFKILGGVSASSALYASNSSIAANIFQLQDNTTDVLKVADGGAVTISPNQDVVGLVVKQTSAGTPSSDIFNIQNASSVMQLQVTSSGAINIGNSSSGNYVTFDATTRELTFNGTARHQKNIKLIAEYPGATMTGDGTNNTGTMTSDNTTTNSTPGFMNYYDWTTTTGGNDYSIWVRVPIPDDWAAWNGTGTIWGYTTGVGDDIALNIYDAGNQLACNSTDIASSSNWQSYSLCNYPADAGGGGWSGNMVMQFTLRANTANNHVRIGDIVIPYYSKW